MLACNTYFGFSLTALSFALISNLGISLCAPAVMSLTLGDFKENTGLAVAFINTIRMFGSSLLSILVGYLLMDNLNALPWGLILIGLATFYCAWHFNRLADSEDNTELDSAEAV
jgi:DHA1 family bicyclomycin/chloramphenicol resistance-like MFS transporter